MDLDQFIEKLSSETGVVRIEVMPDELMDEIVMEESTVEAAGGMKVINTGLEDCLRRKVRLCVFTDTDFIMPECPTMRMLDADGNIIGHDLSPGMIEEYSSREDVMFLSDDFIVYSDADMCGDASMEMLPIRYRGIGEWILEEWDAVLWYSSPSSSEIISGHFEERRFGLAAGVMGLNL